MSRARNAQGYDGAHYRSVKVYLCDCGFSTPVGTRLPSGGYPGGKVMIAHLEREHGWARGKDASYHGSWDKQTPDLLPEDTRCPTCGFKGGNGYIEVGANHEDRDCPDCTQTEHLLSEENKNGS